MSYFHEEQTFRSPWVWGILAFAFLPLSVAALLGHFNSDLLEGVTVVLFITALFLLARLVIDVDATQIRISFHFLWPTRRIPISDVRTARAKEYNSLLDYGGWGVRLSRAGWAFNTGGAQGVLVEIKRGKRIMIGSHRAKELEAAIARAVAEGPGA